jgi:hypothetical protein
MTVNAAIDCLESVGQCLTTQELQNAAAILSNTLEIVARVTDHDHVRDNAGKLVAILATLDISLAAETANILQQRLGKSMWRSSINQSLERAGRLDEKLKSDLLKACPSLDLGPGVDTESEPNNREDAMTFEEAKKALALATKIKAETTEFDVRYDLRRRLILLCASATQLSEAALILNEPGDIAKLALQAFSINEESLAKRFAAESARHGRPLLGWDWDWDQSKALFLLCKLDRVQAKAIIKDFLSPSLAAR